MRRRLARVALLVALLGSAGAACKSGSPDADPARPERRDSQKGAPPMTDMDPQSPEAWRQAEAIAATAAQGKLTKRSDALPFLFTAERPPAILVHHGQIVRGTGPAVAGAYLRDLGIIMGQGPQLGDVLFLLAALDALPPVKDVPRDAYVNAPDDAALADVTARVEFDGVTATVTLTYFLGPATAPKGAGAPPAPGDTVGSRDPDYKPTAIRPIARCTLAIPTTGDATWQIERLNRAG